MKSTNSQRKKAKPAPKPSSNLTPSLTPKPTPNPVPNPMRQFCADQSLRCPGLAILKLEDGKAKVEEVCHLKSKAGTSHAEALQGIYIFLIEHALDVDVFVRERAFCRFATETQALFKVVGIADQVAWQISKAQFRELSPMTVKRFLAGTGKGSKEDVAQAQKRYVGDREYATDDESDAVAVGIAYLLQEGLIENFAENKESQAKDEKNKQAKDKQGKKHKGSVQYEGHKSQEERCQKGQGQT